MNAERFIDLLHHPDRLAEVTYRELQEAVQAFPFCQNLRLLLLQKSQQEQNEHLSANIRLAAAYSNDRSHFYRFFKNGGGAKDRLNPFLMAESFLEQNPNFQTASDSVPTASADPLPSEEPMQLNLSDPDLEDITHEINLSNFNQMEEDHSKKFNLEEHLKNFREEQEEPIENPAQPIFKEKGENVFFLEDLIEEETAAEIPEEATIEEEVPKLPEEQVLEIIDLSEKEIESTPEEEIVEASPPIVQEEVQEEKQEEEETPPPADAKNANSTSEDIPLEITNIPIEEQPPPLPKPVPKTSFSSWLKKFESPKPNIAPEPPVSEPDLPKESTFYPTQQEAPVMRVEEIAKPPKKSKKKSKKAQKLKDLGKQGEESRTSEKKPKKGKKKKKIRDFAAQSLNDDEEIASETLATILAKQGAYSKAIRIYERLKLIYPKKSSFFASKIEELNKLL